jgi:hypothetical protein
VSDDDDITAMLDLPLAKSNRGDIMDDKKELHTDMNKEDLVAKMELLTNDPNLYDRKHMTRCGGGLNNEDTKQEVLSKVGNMTLIDTVTLIEARKPGMLATKSLGSKMSSTVVNQVQKKTEQQNCSYCGNKGHGRRANFETRKAMCPAHGQACTKCRRQDHFAAVCESVKEEVPANNKMVAKHDVQNNINTYGMDVANTHPEFDITEIGTNEPRGKTTFDMKRLHAREEPPDNEVLPKYEHSHNGNMITQNNLKKSTTSSQKGDEYEPTDDVRREEAYFIREVPINIDEIHQEDVANYRQIDGESRGSP